jgi:tripartite-type tricarboxylate transporter receptor subunit TctC
MPTTRRTLIAAAAALAVFSAAHAAEGDYPSRPITIVVPHAPGGPVDGVARMFADKLKDELGQSVVVENRAGASSMIGAASVARSAPDGYTLYINASLHSINPLLYKNSIKYDSVKDFTPISLLAQGPLAFLVNPHVKATTAQEFAKEIKASPEKISFATGGFGAADHLASAYFLHEIGRTDVPIVLYKGGAPALQDLMGGAVQAKMDAMLTALPLVKGGKVRALAVTTAKRSPVLPQVPTYTESGIPGVELASVWGVMAPAGTPEAVIQRINTELNKALQQPDMREKILASGAGVLGGSPQEMGALYTSDRQRLAPVVRDSGTRLD